MTYQQIVDMIRDTSAAVNPNGFFLHGRREDFSLHFDNTSFRFGYAGICLVAPTPRTTIDRVNGLVTHDLVMVFMQQDRHDTSEVEREAIIANMDLLSENFMDYLFNNYTANITNEIKTPDYRQFMGTLSGYAMTFRINGYITCNNDEF